MGGHHKERSSSSRKKLGNSLSIRRPGTQIKMGTTQEEKDFIERLQYMDTALEALPGRTLREFFAPVIRLQKNLIMRKHRTALNMGTVLKATKPLPSIEDVEPVVAAAIASAAAEPERVAGEKVIVDALQRLSKSLMDVGSEICPGSTMPLDVDRFTASLRYKCEPVSYGAEEVVCYPNESPESMFVYILVSGTATISHFQPLLQRPTIAGQTRRQFYTSSKESILLCGGGVLVDNPRAAALARDGNIAAGTGGGQPAETGSNPGDARTAHDGASTSNVASAMIKNLRLALRAVGQPSLELMRTETVKAPAVIGAAEALGMAPFHCATISASPPSTKQVSRLLGDHLDVIRIRMLDVHDALVEAALHQAAPSPLSSSGSNTVANHNNNNNNTSSSKPPQNPPGEGPTNHASTATTLADFITTARARAIDSYYPQSETLMRQSWLLQDTPAQTIRHLITHLTPQTFMPGDILACPHGSTPRQLCFLRRGEFYIAEPPPDESKRRGTAVTGHSHSKHVACNCDGRTVGDIFEVVYPGASFGELSVLFGEPRDYTLVAKTVCDVWCLTYRDFSLTMQRDDALRKTLVQKAAALRIKWLAEQRFSPQLTKHLRESCEMFRPFPDIILRLIQERIEPVVYSPGELVASTAERCKEMIFIIQGRVESLVKGLATYGSGHVLGAGCLVAHRWPLALSAKTMVEGWRLSRERLVDALERADFLHAHSGERTSLLSQYIRQVFRPPLPDFSGDVAERNQMPIVPGAPGGTSYPEYGKRVSEIMLRAMCVLFKGFVKWEEINYASMEGGAVGERSNALARRQVIQELRQLMDDRGQGSGRAAEERAAAEAQSAGKKKSAGSKTAKDESLHVAFDRENQKNNNKSPRSRHLNQSSTDLGVGSGRAAAKAKQQQQHGKTRRKRTTGSCPFLVDDDAAEKPFVATVDRRPPIQKGVDQTFLKKVQQKPLMGSSFSVQDASSTNRLRRMVRIPPKLNQFKRILEERDLICSSENLNGTFTSAPGGMDGDSHSDAMTKYSNRERQKLAMTAELIMEERRGGCYAGEKQVLGAITPVHLFLQAEKPKGEITVEEAMAIGLVLQLPTASGIQSCVPIVDPDVCIGLPQHRARRFAMAVTPNDRHHKHNFLFAAARLDEDAPVAISGLKPIEKKDTAPGSRSHSVNSTGAESARSNVSSARRSAASGAAGSPMNSGRSGVTDGAHGNTSAAEAEHQRLKTETLVTMLRASITHRQEEFFQRNAEAVKQRAGLSIKPKSIGDRSAASMRDPHQPTELSIRGVDASAVTRSLSVGGSNVSSPQAGPQEQLFLTDEKRAQAEQHMVQQLLHKPQEALEQLFTRFEGSSAPSNGNAMYRTSHNAAFASGSFLFPAQEGSNNVSVGDDPLGLQRQTMLERLKELSGWPPARCKGGDNQTQAPPAHSTNGALLPALTTISSTPLQPPQLQFVERDPSGKLRLSASASVLSRPGLGGTQPSSRVASVNPSRGTAGGADKSLTGAEGNSITSSAATPGLHSTPLDRFFADKRKVLFVDGLGSLNAAEDGSVVPIMRRAGSGSGGGMRSSFSMSGAYNNPELSLAGMSLSHLAGFEGGGDRSPQMGGGSGFGSQTSPGYSMTLHDVGGYMGDAPLTPADFVMPSAAEAAEFMDRMQRDVEGLNAVAAEQTREREKMRIEQLRRGKAYEEVQQILSVPTDEERELIELWKQEHEVLLKDPLTLSHIPRALLRHAGPNYLEAEIRQANEYVAPMVTTNKSVLAWHDEVQEGWESLVPPGTSAAELTAGSPLPRGGLKKKTAGLTIPGDDDASGVPGGPAAAGSSGRRSSAAKRVIAAVGTRQLGTVVKPLHHPARDMKDETYKGWVRQREEFLENYAKMFENEPHEDADGLVI